MALPPPFYQYLNNHILFPSSKSPSLTMSSQFNRITSVDEKWQCPNLMCTVSLPHQDINAMVIPPPPVGVATLEIARFAPTNNAFVGHNIWCITTVPPQPLENRIRVFFRHYGTVTIRARKFGGLQVPGWVMFEGLDDDNYTVISLAITQSWTVPRPKGPIMGFLRMLLPHRRSLGPHRYLQWDPLHR
ncbi:hypothetical protein FIBSPDRAFT_965095 [Athelia psychrophila]|uniref:Uncharacterized protein n=1 Tax=Athelia psychrophila TaxID=1759441 RepID=A0A165X1E4_9AGAM|nr:hypothetical protein FIBSPDRAFT_965095 [Fibularhizoctonia sp. CBS 109695]